MDFLNLGATLYVPATRDDLVDIANGHKIKNLRSVVFCTEDAVAENMLPEALNNLWRSLPKFQSASLYRFIRPRNPEILEKLLNIPAIVNIDGFVLPKVTIDNLDLYFRILAPYEKFKVMLTLETQEVFNPYELYRMRDFLAASPYKERILTIRIGGLDLLNILGIRRDCNRTIYDTPIGTCISQLVTTFKPLGFNLSGPAYECFENYRVLYNEVELDLLNGLFGKTAVHPQQIDIIQSAYRVNEKDFEMAQMILDPASPAIFRMHDTMCEKATHRNWAQGILQRANVYGIREICPHEHFEVFSRNKTPETAYQA